MKKALNFFAGTALLLSVGLFGCLKEDPAKQLEVDWNKTGIVSGKILYVNDVSGTPPYKYEAPRAQDVALRAIVAYSDFVDGAGGVYQIPNDKITYDPATGVFTVEVPTGDKGGEVEIMMSDFVGTRLEPNPELPTQSVRKDGYWALTPNIKLEVNPGQTTVGAYKRLTFTEQPNVGSQTF